MKLRYTPEALNDLAELKQYVQEDLSSPMAAGRIIRSITASCSLLKDQPKLGMELSKLIDRETDYRYLITGNYIVFYKIEINTISVYRVINARTDYIRNLGFSKN